MRIRRICHRPLLLAAAALAEAAGNRLDCLDWPESRGGEGVFAERAADIARFHGKFGGRLGARRL
jgi:hypothetical protein